MDIGRLVNATEVGLYTIFIFTAICMVLRFILMEYQLYKRDCAAVETVPATAYYKHPDMEPVLAGRSSTYVYHITFHTDSGECLKLYMTAEQYYAIEEGSRGTLTWQGPRFWKFEQEE